MFFKRKVILCESSGNLLWNYDEILKMNNKELKEIEDKII